MSSSVTAVDSAMVAGFLDYLQAECGLSLNTRKAYRRDLRHFADYLAEIGSSDIRGVSPREIEGFLRYLKRLGLAVSSAARALAAVRMLCRYLVLQRVLESDISESVETPKKWNRLPTVLNDSTVQLLLAAPQPGQDRHWLRDRAMLSLLYAAGVRASELATLKVEDVNFGVGVIRVMGKGSKERIVPVARQTLALVQDYVRQIRPQQRGVLLLSRTDQPLAREDVYRIVRKYVLRAALRGGVSPHTLRHCFATQLLSNGADLRSVQEMLGHADIATTEIYTHVDASRLKNIHKQFHPRG